MNSTDQNPPEAILAELARLRATDAPTHGGRVLAYVYDSGLAEIDRLAGDAAALVQPVNGLDPTTFGSVAVIERDLISFARDAFGSSDAVGSLTSGGTESCLLAVLSAREYTRAPAGAGNIVIPSTAHAAFDKAGKLLGVQVRRVPVGPVTTSADVDAMARAIDDATIMLVGSAPNYPTGTSDPIADLGELALRRGVALHVDACLGGLALAWWPTPLPDWDLRVPGVTSLSADFHKYGYAPKGVSILLHTDRDRHRAAYFATTDWPGYPVVNPTLLGSKSAAGPAAAWAVTRYLGGAGFARLVADIADTSSTLIDVVDGIDGLRVIGEPVGPVFAVAADTDATAPIDPHRWADEVADRGFTLQAQPAYRQSDGTELPASTHLTITPVTSSVVEDLSRAMREGAGAARGLDRAEAPEALRELAVAFDSGALGVDDALSLDSASTEAVLIGAGIDPHTDPARAAQTLDLSAVISAIEALPRPVTAKMLVEFLAAYSNPVSQGA